MTQWGNCDFKQLVQLQKRLEQFIEVGEQEFCIEIAKEIAARLLRKVILRTPVDTGVLEGSWREENNQFYVDIKGNTYEITITNSINYASYVEFGHRSSTHNVWVDGRYMLTISEMEIQEIAPRLIEKRLYERLVQVFG